VTHYAVVRYEPVRNRNVRCSRWYRNRDKAYAEAARMNASAIGYPFAVQIVFFREPA
jgi:hypothetical protein